MKKSEEKKIYILSIAVLVLAVFSCIGFYFYFNYLQLLKDSPYDLVVSDIQANSAVISWKTESDMPTYIKLGKSGELLGSGEVSKFHRVKVVDLDEKKSYEFKVSDGQREWYEDLVKRENEIATFTKKMYSFTTSPINEEISLPEVRELHVLPNELVYVSLYDTKKNIYSELKSYYANKFGGIVIDLRAFKGEWVYEDIEIRDINYFVTSSLNASNIEVYAAEINCNQDLPEQKINGITKQEFAQLATRWVAGRGKHYAIECFNDVVYRSKMAGVDPAFTLAVWLNESGASNYTQDENAYGYIEDWGIHGRDDVPVHDFSAQLNHFLKRGHYNVCPGLTQWEAWGNIYRWGRCNADNPVAREEGIDYYKKTESLYRWITNGKNLPRKVTGLAIPINEHESWSEESGNLCCGIKLEKSDTFVGIYESNVGEKGCSDIEFTYPGTIEYSAQIPNRDANTCEVKYTGVCCELENDIKWYPQQSCTNIVEGINSSKECIEYAKDMACFFRDGKYKWLTNKIGTDTIEGVTTQVQCESRNSIKTYSIELKEGVNFVGFDFSPSYHISPLYASTLLEQYPDISVIGNFQGYEWKDLVKQSEKIPFAGNDFYFEQNRGYLIIADKSITLKLDGWRNPDAQYEELEKGWNLVGGSIYSNPSKASTLISNLKENDIEINSVGVWAYDFDSLKVSSEKDGEVQGVDIDLTKQDAIFLKR